MLLLCGLVVVRIQHCLSVDLMESQLDTGALEIKPPTEGGVEKPHGTAFGSPVGGGAP